MKQATPGRCAIEAADTPARYSTDDTARRLAESLAALEWALARVPERWHHSTPRSGRPADTEPPWSVAMNLAHMAVYEERLAAPVLEALLAGEDGRNAAPSSGEDWFAPAARALSDEPAATIVGRLRSARLRQIEAVRRFDDERFNAPQTPLWSDPRRAALPDPPGWVATKTLQHTWEHGNAVMQAALWGELLYPAD